MAKTKKTAGAAADTSPLLVYGRHAVQTALTHGKIVQLFYCPNRQGNRQPASAAIAEQAARRGIPVRHTDTARLQKMLGGDAKNARHQDIAATIQPPHADWHQLLALSSKSSQSPAPPLVVIDGVTDSRNLGALLRVARAFAVAAVIAPTRRSAPLNSVAAQASAGAGAVLPLVRAVNLARALRQIRDAGWQTVGAAEDADTDLFAAAQSRLAPPLCWVFGDEGSGMRRLTREHCDTLVRIPTVPGTAGCLNITTAAAICLAHSGAAE